MSSTKRSFAASCGYLAAIFLVASCLSPGEARAVDDPEPEFRFSMEAALFGRHPELVQRPDFREWREDNEVGAWRETECVGDKRQVLILAAGNRERVFAAELKDCETAVRSSVLQTESFDVAGKPESAAVASTAWTDSAEAQSPQDPQQEQELLRPVVDFSTTPAQLSWELEIRENGQHRSIEFENGNRVRDTTEPAAAPVRERARAAASPLDAADLVVDNDLHHVEEFRAEAKEWAGNASTRYGKAQRIYQAVKNKYRYDAQIPGIDRFTWSDRLTRDVNGYRGICDEWSVVQVSYLRSLGIPARVIFLSWYYGLVKEAHAAVEFQDEQRRWHQMDALFGFDDPTLYKNRYAISQVKVTLATEPRDSRSSAPVKGLPDPDGDERLSPYADFVIKPLYQNLPQAGGYSD